MDRLLTQSFIPEGGVISNQNAIVLGIQRPGALISARNFEPDNKNGGYRRLSGYSKYDSNALTGTGAVLGCWVFNEGVLAVRGQYFYFSSGVGWSAALNGTAMNASATKYRGIEYDFTGDAIVIVNSYDYPVRYDGTTFTHLTNASYPNIPTGLQGATCVEVFKAHMFACVGDTLFHSSPADEEDWSSGSGGGALDLGFSPLNMMAFRDSLYLFGREEIYKLEGNDATDFVLKKVANFGTIAADSIQEVNSDLVFLAKDGLRTVSATDRIGDVNLENLSRNIDKNIDALALNSGNSEISSIAYNSKNQYRLILSDSTADVTDQKGILGGLRKTIQGNLVWEWFETLGIQGTCAGQGFIGSVETIIHGTEDGYIIQQESGNDFDGSTVDAFIQFPYWTLGADQDLTEIRKVLHKLNTTILAEGTIDPEIAYIMDLGDFDKIQADTIGDVQPSVGFSLYDESTAVYGTATYGDDAQNIKAEFNLVGTCFNVSFIYRSNDTLAPWTVQFAGLEYGLAGRR